tara:strand:- start:764 stop:1450 length:687 start_codon:yes stop_codon:yes gene_type:complete
MASISQEEIIALLTLLGNSLLPSELTEITSVTTDNNYLFLNSGVNDAQKIKIPLLRGVLGSYNATTNTPSLSNGTGLSGDNYTVSVAGTRDFGNGAISLIVDDVIFYNGSKYIKLIQRQVSDIVGLQSTLNNKVGVGSLGDSFYTEEGILYSNISTYRQLINYTSGTQVFTLDFEPTFFIGIFVNGQYLDEVDYIYTSPNQLEILGTMESGDRIKFIYEHFINEPQEG